MTQKFVDDALRLAAIYSAGVGTQWNSYRDAAAKLSRQFETQLSPPRIAEALAASKLPPAVRKLFEQTGLTNGNARAILALAKELGKDALAARAIKIDASGLSAREILRALRSGGELRLPRAAPQSNSPLAIAAHFRANRFASQSAAAEQMGVRQSRVSEALNIAKTLPAEVKALFPGDALSFAAAKQILRFIALLGEETIRIRALEIGNLQRRPSVQGILNRLAGVELPGVDVRVRKAPGRNTKGRMIVEMHLQQSDPESEAALRLIAEMINTRFGIQ